ncbi:MULTISPECIES: 3'-5' exonuclease [unclassified Clostridium]|uniref:3'-5' exonuclease n=1 Tax=unclassified Clostridium TaxID=2614128 RepID=UPI000297B380|nr:MULTISPECIES: 3'-5' exonuclease [unclassified Clostridium]EKQ51714.1 MAG: DNA polymerase III epsilon subunit-like 3'-5' exonuclease [Clostridium sp. Maddingley MBC34-26]
MYYIVYDLEFNQKINSSSEVSSTTIKSKKDSSVDMPFEIIQIGAVKLNENFETVSTFDSLVKPTLYKSIHPYIESLTRITLDKIVSCKNFIEVYEDFVKFIGSEEVILCVWGMADIKELIRNIKYYNLPDLKNYKYIDVQKYASKYFNAPNKSRIGLRNTIEFLHLPMENEFHDAFNDAAYTAEIFKIIYNNTMKPMLYTPAPSKRISKPKEKIDMTSLINEFEKIYNREMTKEEKTIIRLAYMMGRTRQFIIKK